MNTETHEDVTLLTREDLEDLVAFLQNKNFYLRRKEERLRERIQVLLRELKVKS